MRQPGSVQTGLEVLIAQEFAPLRGLRIGLVAHPASVDRHLRHAAVWLQQARDLHLVRLFGPEHGIVGHAQDLEGVVSRRDPLTGLEVVSLYGTTVESLHPPSDSLRDLDALVIDLMDVGSRYYTFQATMLYCLEAASRQGLLSVILDRPNPLGGLTVEGPTLQPAFASFVGPEPIAIRHGLTMGELATLYRTRRGWRGELQVIPCQGWKRSQYFDETDLPWVLPSPNMPTLETALVYPGQCLLEGTNLSEGRGTTRPFELCGAPDLDANRLADRLRQENLPGVIFRPVYYCPTFQKHAGTLCGGVQVHVTDRQTFQPVRTGLALLAAMREQSPCFAWRTEPYEFVSEIPAIDLLFGSARERLGLEAGHSWRELARAWEPEEAVFREQRREALLYE